MTEEVKLRFCTYCRFNKPEKDFTRVFDKRGYQRNWKCGDCSAMKGKTVEEREALSKRRVAAAKEAEARWMKEVVAARTKKQYNEG